MIEETELYEVRGGIKYGIVAIIGGVLTFIIGVIDGYQRPIACGK